MTFPFKFPRLPSVSLRVVSPSARSSDYRTLSSKLKTEAKVILALLQFHYCIGTEAGLSNNESGMVRLPNRYSANKLPNIFLSHPFCLLASINSTRRMRRSSQRREYIPLACNASSHSLTPMWDLPSLWTLSATPSRSKTTRWFNRARTYTWPPRPYYTSRN